MAKIKDISSIVVILAIIAMGVFIGLTIFENSGSSVGQATKISGDDAQILSQSLEAPTHVSGSYRMLAGQSYDASITLKNTGDTNWRTKEGYHLQPVSSKQARNSPSRWGVDSLYIREGALITRGTEYTFDFSVLAPLTEGDYSFQWQMAKQMSRIKVDAFGKKTDEIIVQVRDCIDLDEGINDLSSKTTVLDRYGNSLTDQCSNRQGYLLEASCSNTDRAQAKEMKCPSGQCSDGVCV